MASGEQLQLADISVDDLFKDHSIQYVRSLHNEYKGNVKNAKTELHSLVGQKYRDLIRIAEDIDGMNNTSSRINQKIGNLSYSKSKHAVFGQNNHARFNSIVRSRRSKNARTQSQNTILNNIINNKLIDFDLKIKTDSLASSAYLVHMAQLYHTVSSVFAEIIGLSSSFNQTFSTLKQNYLDFLESRLARITTTDANGSYLHDNIMPVFSTQWIEGDDVEILPDFYEEDGSDDISDIENNSFKHHRHSSNPIFNYLTAYIIMSAGQADLGSMEALARKFLSIRLTYVNSILESKVFSQPSTASNISFPALLNFIQSTKTYLKEYFSPSDSNEILNFFQSISTWRATDFIGFHNWFSDDEVRFVSIDYASTLAGEEFQLQTLENFEEILRTCFERILKSESSEDAVLRCDRAMSLFYNFVCSARKSEVLAEWNASLSIIEDFCHNSNLVSDIFQLTLSHVRGVALAHQKTLPDVLFTERTSSSQLAKDRLFSQEFVSSIDEDVTEYYRKVLLFASFDDKLSGSNSSSDTASCLKRWFQVENTFLDNCLSQKSPIIEKLMNVLKKSYRNSKDFESWGEFNVELFTRRFSETSDTLVSNLLSSFADCIDQIQSNIEKAIQTRNERDLILWLHISSITASNLAEFQKSDVLRSKLLSGMSKIYSKMFTDLENFQSFGNVIFDLFFQPETMVPGFESATVPVRPHLIVYSAMQRLSASLLQSTAYSQDELLELYSGNASKSVFVQKKNDWISQVLIKGGLDRIKSSLLTKSKDSTSAAQTLADERSTSADDINAEMAEKDSDSTEVVNQTQPLTLSTEQSRQLLANVVFMICLTTDEEVTINNPHLIDVTAKINEMSGEVIEGSALSIITRGVSKNYFSSKETYLPLSLN